MTYEQNYLAHYGITGQKWGVKRYQNSDGSYTPAGRERHRVAEAENNSSSADTKMPANSDVSAGDNTSVKSDETEKKEPASIYKVQAAKKKKETTSGKGKGKGKKGKKGKTITPEKGGKSSKPKAKARRLSEYASKVRKFKSQSRNEQLSRALS